MFRKIIVSAACVVLLVAVAKPHFKNYMRYLMTKNLPATPPEWRPRMRTWSMGEEQYEAPGWNI